MSPSISIRDTAVDLSRVDPTQVQQADNLIATWEPTSEVGHVLRDVLQAIQWAQRESCHREVAVLTTRTTREA